jgi:predicted nucleic acid-binding protein
MPRKSKLRVIVDTNCWISFLIGRRLSRLVDLLSNESPAVQEEKHYYELPKHINVPRLINPNIKSSKKSATGKRQKKKTKR